MELVRYNEGCLPMEKDREEFGPDYYAHSCGDLPYGRSGPWLDQFARIADNIVRTLHPKRVLDAGCAMGMLVEQLVDRGVEAHGIDVSRYAISQVRLDIQPFCRQGSLTDPIDGRFDLVACIEVLEHLQPGDCAAAMRNLCAVTDTILFSSTPLDLTEATHYNVQPLWIWIRQFGEHGFRPDPAFDAAFVSAHAMLLRRGMEAGEREIDLYARFLLQRAHLAAHDRREEKLRNEVERAKALADEAWRCAGAHAQHIVNLDADIARERKRVDQLRVALDCAWQSIGAVTEERREAWRSAVRTAAELAALRDRAASERERIEEAAEQAAVEAANWKREHRALIADRQRHGAPSIFRKFGARLGWINSRKRAAAAITPLVDAEFYLARHPQVLDTGLTAAEHYLAEGAELDYNPHPLFHTAFYKQCYADAAGVNPLLHYVEQGAAEGRWPGPLFDPDCYRRVAPVPVGAANPLLHFLETAGNRTVSPHPLFDCTHYLSQVADAARSSKHPLLHYLLNRQCWQASPHLLFDGVYYTETYPDILESNTNPLEHFLLHGGAEGRSPHPLFDTPHYAASAGLPAGVNPLLHFATIGARELRDPHPLFDMRSYRGKISPGSGRRDNLLVHYLARPVEQRSSPHPLFDDQFFAARYPGVARSGKDLLIHYIQRGLDDRLWPNPAFDGAYYATHIRGTGMNPLVHYVLHGADATLRPHPDFDAAAYAAAHPACGGPAGALRHYLAMAAPRPEAARPAADPADLVRHTKPVSIVVAVHNALDDVKKCLSSVVRFTTEPYELILVDDGSDEATKDYLAEFAASQRALCIRNETARGYTVAANTGLRAATGEAVVLLNSDTIVTSHWVDRLMQCAESDETIGMVGPLSNTASWQSVPAVSENGDWAANPLPQDCSVEEMAAAVAAHSGRTYPRIDFLNGFCLLIKRALLDAIGLFDEPHFGRGYGEENDYSVRARAAGFSLAVADDVYVYHAQSRSYSHERRKELCLDADRHLRAKHGSAEIDRALQRLLADAALPGIRARIKSMFARQELIERSRNRWEGRRVAFVLPVFDPGGGANVVLQEARAMQRFGVDVAIVNLERFKRPFEAAFRPPRVRMLWAESEDRIGEVAGSYDAVVATANWTVEWLRPLTAASRPPVLGYYVQDYEPFFYDPGTAEFERAKASYSLFAGLRRFTKTNWNRDVLLRETGCDAAIVGPSVDIDLFRPRHASSHDERVRLCAMIRPSSPRRAPAETMALLRQLSRKFSDRIAISVFGCSLSDPAFVAMPGDFHFQNHGILNAAETAALLSRNDIFLDFSHYQAMGLTAMEAMACGNAAVVPEKGGAAEFARHRENCLQIDTASEADRLAAAAELIANDAFRNRLRMQALEDAVAFPPERPAARILETLFGPTG